ncbi:MAG: hypothetical protein AB7F43_03545 [Bacteriovoracia bacterium]
MGVLLDACAHFKHAGEDFLENLKKHGIEMSPSASLSSLSSLNSKIENCEIEGAGHFPFLFEGHRRRVVEAIEHFALELNK